MRLEPHRDFIWVNILTDAAVLFLLPIQELHERPQHGVSICLSSAVVGRAFDLVQDLSHLTHAAVDASMKTAGRRSWKRKLLRGWLLRYHQCKGVCVFVCVYLLANTVLKLSR